jgi:Family of unknown function (DUF6152)
VFSVRKALARQPQDQHVAAKEKLARTLHLNTTRCAERTVKPFRGLSGSFLSFLVQERRRMASVETVKNVLMRKLRRNLLLLTVCIGFTAAAGSALAHHAFAAEYDGDKPFDLTGTVTKVHWINPHSWLYFDVAATDGTLTNWGVEFGAPNALADAGLKRADVAPGTRVRIQGFLSKNGGPTGYSVKLLLNDGRVIRTGGAQDSPAFQSDNPGAHASAPNGTQH